MKLKTFLIGMLLSVAVAVPAFGLVTLPYTFTAGQPIAASQVNANDQALRDGINGHLSASNPHNTTLAQILSQGNSCGATSINFNGTQGVNFEVENLGADPTCNSGARGRLIWNTVDSLFKICNGTSFVSIAGSGVNTLQSVLTAGNSAGSLDLDMNSNEILNLILELRTSDGTPSTGRVFYRTDTEEFKVCDGTTCTALGGAQGLASVLGVSNSAGSTNIDFNGTEAINFLAQKLASDPTGAAARIYYNTGSNVLKFHNGSAWSEIGNTQGLDDVIAIDNDAGGNIDMENNELLRAKLENLASTPGNGNAGRVWFNSTLDMIIYDDGAADRTVCSLDQTQTLTNKTISGSSNTITNVQDSALSSNVMLRDGVQSVSGAKTFASSKLVVSDIATPAGGKHILTDGLADDTITLNNAVQTLNQKTFGASSMAGNFDFNNYQATEFRIENRGTNPSVGNAGRLWYHTTTGEIRYDTGSGVRVLSSSGTPVNDPWSVDGNGGLDDTTNFLGTTDAVDLVFKTNGVERFRIQDDGDLDTTLSAGVCHVDSSGIITSSNVVNADIDSSAAIARSKIASGTAHRILINSVTGAFSEIGPLTNGQTLIGSTGNAPVAATLTGTTNRINVSSGAGSITLSTPQNIHTTADVNFASVTLSDNLNVTDTSTFTGKVAMRIATDSSTGTDIVINDPTKAVVSLNDSGLVSISGIPVSEADGQLLLLINNTTVDVTIKNQDAGASADNRIITGTGADIVLAAQGALFLVHDADPVQRWRVVGGTGTGGVDGPVSSTDEAVVRWDGTGGDTTQDSVVLITDIGEITGVKDITATGLVTTASLNVTSLTANRALVTDGSSNVVSATTTAAEIGFVNGVTSAIQTQLDAKNAIRAITGTFGSPTSITAGGGLAAPSTNGDNIRFVQGSGGSVNITANPQIADGISVGQRMTIIGKSDTNSLIFETGTGLSLKGSAELGDNDVLEMMWDGNDWIEVGRNF